MTPCGARGFGDIVSAKAAVKSRPEITTYVIIRNAPRPFAPPEYAWVAPVEVFMERATKAMAAGITLVEMVTA